MGKKSKKKTIASTKKALKTEEQLQQESQQKEQKKLLKKIFSRKKKNQKEEKAKKENNESVVAEMKNNESKAETKIQNHEKAAEKSPNPESTKKEKTPRKPVFNESQKQRTKGAVLVLIGLFMIGFVSYFLYTRLFRPESIAHLVPAQNTLGFLEVNIDGDSDQVKKFENLFGKYPVYQPSNLAQLANWILPVDYNKDLSPWIGRSVGVVLLKQNADDNNVKLAVFLENKNSEKTLDFLKSRALANSGDELLTDTYNNYTIYHYKLSQNYAFTFINNYLVLAGNEALLQQIIDAQNGNIPKLQDDPVFQKVNNNVPSTGLAFGYVNMQKLFDTMLRNPMFQSQKTRDLIALQPFMKIFSAEGFTLVADDTNLTIQQFEAIDRSQLQGQSYLTYEDKYQGELLQLANENAILFAGGHNLYKEFQRVGEIFQTGTNIDSTLFNGILEAQKDKYFGKDISLENDIYPLLQNEYLLTTENNFDEPVVSIFMNLTNKNNDMLRVEKLATAFMKQRAIFSPEIKDVTLPDGTKGQEVVASAEDITRTDNQYNGYNITTLQLGSLKWSINYAVLDNTLVISTSPDALKNIIDRKDGKITTSLRNSDDFNKNVMPAMRTADEIFNIKLGALIPVLGLDQNPAVKPYVEPFNSLTMAKNFFDDGISTLYVINVL